MAGSRRRAGGQNHCADPACRAAKAMDGRGQDRVFERNDLLPEIFYVLNAAKFDYDGTIGF